MTARWAACVYAPAPGGGPAPPARSEGVIRSRLVRPCCQDDGDATLDERGLRKMSAASERLVPCWGLGVLLGFWILIGVLALCWVLGAEGKRSVENIRSRGPLPCEANRYLESFPIEKV
jgi:hypothetical protein